MSKTPDLSSLILERLDAVTTQVAYLAERQRKQEELFAEMAPIARVAVAEAIARFDVLERRGYFAFADELLRVGQRVVEGFKAEDVHQLGDSIVAILQTLRGLTQPTALQVIADASAAIEDADSVKPLGLLGVVRATRKDDVQKGIALLVEVLRRIGHGVNTAATRQLEAADRKQTLGRLLGPSRAKKALDIERPQLPAAAPACAAPPRPAAVGAVVDGIAYTADGHLVDPAAWSRELAEKLAAAQSITLAEPQWTIVEAARAEFGATGVSPNIRRLTQVAVVTTKDLYSLFPKAPARTIAKIAGLPKPAGCL